MSSSNGLSSRGVPTPSVRKWCESLRWITAPPRRIPAVVRFELTRRRALCAGDRELSASGCELLVIPLRSAARKSKGVTSNQTRFYMDPCDYLATRAASIEPHFALGP